MIRIKVKLKVSQITDRATFFVDELGYTDEMWNLLSVEERHKVIQKEINNLDTQLYWVLDSFAEY